MFEMLIHQISNYFLHEVAEERLRVAVEQGLGDLDVSAVGMLYLQEVLQTKV